MKEEISKDLETLKNNQSKINNSKKKKTNSISQINITIKAW
jgi:hypothetical protein